MVGAENPARGIALHAAEADEGVLDGVVERMAHMEHARDVRRRNDDGAVLVAFGTAVVCAVQPFRKHALLDAAGVVCLWKLFHVSRLLDESCLSQNHRRREPPQIARGYRKKRRPARRRDAA